MKYAKLIKLGGELIENAKITQYAKTRFTNSRGSAFLRVLPQNEA